jgi:sugar O-acyltransferase (sialic acid O-acetyltransferase NeuD family)
MSNKKLAIIGAGDLGELIAYHAPSCGYTVVGYFDDTKEIGAFVNGVSVLGGLNNVFNSFSKGDFTHMMLGVGYKHFTFRKKVFEDLITQEVPLATLIHPSCIVMHDVEIGAGCMLLPGCVLDKGVVLKENVLLNTGVVIAHDTLVGAHSFLAPRVALAGFITIEECCMLGTNATVIDNIHIQSEIIVGAGAVVVTDLLEKGTYIGVPAKKMLL